MTARCRQVHHHRNPHAAMRSIVEPLTAKVQLTMNKGVRTKTTPNVLADLHLSDIAVHVEADAYRIALTTMNRWAMYTRWCAVHSETCPSGTLGPFNRGSAALMWDPLHRTGRASLSTGPPSRFLRTRKHGGRTRVSSAPKRIAVYLSMGFVLVCDFHRHLCRRDDPAQI